MRDVLFVEDPATDGVLMSKRRRHRRRYPTVQPAGPGPIDLPAVALEAESMVAIRPNFTAILEFGLPRLTHRAQDPETLRPTTAFVT